MREVATRPLHHRLPLSLHRHLRGPQPTLEPGWQAVTFGAFGSLCGGQWGGEKAPFCRASPMIQVAIDGNGTRDSLWLRKP